MSLTVKLPDNKTKEEYSLFVSTKITYKKTFADLGTLIICEGCGIAFYSASNSRRAVVFTEIKEKDPKFPVLEGKLPYIKQPVRIIYKARGRKVDLLKFMIYNLEKKYGNRIYGMGDIYWLKLSSFIDSIKKKSKRKGSYRREVFMITEQFLKKENKDENI